MLLEKARTAKDGGKKLYKGGDADLLPALRKLAGWDGAATGRVVGAWDADKNGKLSTGELGAALSDQAVATLRLLKDFLGVTFRIETDADGTLLLACRGAGFKNLSQRVT